METLKAVFEFLQTLPGILLILFVGTGALLTSLVTAWAKNWREVRLALVSSELKAKMIDRGMSAEEIERILSADASGGGKRSSHRQGSALEAMIDNGTDAEGIVKVIEAGVSAENDADNIARHMAENDYEGEDIARVVAALRATQRTNAIPASRPESRPMPDINLDVRDPNVTAGV